MKELDRALNIVSSQTFVLKLIVYEASHQLSLIQVYYSDHFES
jgi:hypothetical protein